MTHVHAVPRTYTSMECSHHSNIMCSIFCSAPCEDPDKSVVVCILSINIRKADASCIHM